jgi:hypothetical protein
MSAVAAVCNGHYFDHGWAVYVTQEHLYCCLLHTTFGLTDEEALWTAVSSWATFQPRQAKPRQDPGFLLYPNEFSHVFEKYWDHLAGLDRHPDFERESEYPRYCMTLFSRGLSGLVAQGIFELRPSAEAKEEDIMVAEHAATSRSRLIQDGLDYWEEHRSSGDTGVGVPGPG